MITTFKTRCPLGVQRDDEDIQMAGGGGVGETPGDQKTEESTTNTTLPVTNI